MADEMPPILSYPVSPRSSCVPRMSILLMLGRVCCHLLDSCLNLKENEFRLKSFLQTNYFYLKEIWFLE